MCKYRVNGCKFRLFHKGLSNQEILEVLNVHNALRSKVATGQERGQPSASNMFMLKWDPELAKIAQRWADQCHFGHDHVRSSFKFNQVGQNVATTSTTRRYPAANFTKAVYMWYDEVTKPGFPSSSVDFYIFNPATGHYSQMIWATTYTVGCGYVAYKNRSWYTQLYICNYGPAGNMLSGRVYLRGASGSKCPKGHQVSVNYKGLCIA